MMMHLASNLTGSKLSQFRNEDVQPNAIDLRIDKIFKSTGSEFHLSEKVKLHRSKLELQPYWDHKDDPGEWWNLKPGTYEVLFEGEVNMASDEAGFVITRSTLNRNGVFITSGLYDSGYKGVMAGAMHVIPREFPQEYPSDSFWLKRGTRVAQFLLFKAEALHEYSGSYGNNSEHDKRYK